MRRGAALLAIALGCAQPDDKSVEGAVMQFVAAAEQGDADRVVKMLDRSTLDRLGARAREASDLAGGGVSLNPADVVAVGFEPADMRIARVTTASLKGGDAVAVVHGADGRTVQVRLRSESGRWKLVLDL